MRDFAIYDDLITSLITVKQTEDIYKITIVKD